jgi:hypothetical protein
MQTPDCWGVALLEIAPRMIVGKDGHLAYRILCIMSGLSLPKVGTIIAQSRDYRCPHFFCQTPNPAFYKDLCVPLGIMHA